MRLFNLKAVFVLLISFIFFNSYSQEEYEDVVYLKNGSIIHGIIIEQVPNVSIKIQTYDRNVFFFKIEEIEKITKELKISNLNQQIDRKTYTLKGNVLEGNFVTIGSSVILSKYSYPTSIGLGIEFNNAYDRAYFAIFCASRLYFTNTKFAPYLGFDLGFAGATKGEAKGLYLNPYSGFRLMINEALAFNFGIGMKFLPNEHDRPLLVPIADLKLGLSYRLKYTATNLAHMP
jgi:hypothetical protein